MIVHTPSEYLLKVVRSKIILRGLSFAAYCRENNLTHQNARAALLGHWKGPKANLLIKHIIDDLGIEN
jgi:hypothetical protein